jgi:hypothetical protein
MDVLRGMLREQKRECVGLHANALFCEFRSKRGAHEAQPPRIDDLEAGACVCVCCCEGVGVSCAGGT